ncbi:MAG: mandelate racemase/muconate lactonizing enzyme family protein [Gemmataceae bacterium]
MRITRIVATLLRLPHDRAVALPLAGQSAGPAHLAVLLVQLETDDGLGGLGFGPVADGGRALVAAIEDDLAPRLVGDDPLHHERLAAKVRELGATSAYAFIDLALWDLKAKAAGLPLWRLLGGLRDRAKAFTAETASASLSANEAIALGKSALSRGFKGVRVGVAGIDPEADSQKVLAVREALGEEIWFAVSVEGRYDYETALPMGRFIEEEVGADWFEDPLADDDVTSYSRLSGRIDTPLAVGGRYSSAGQFVRLLESGTRAVLRPDVLRVGGLTAWLKIAALAELNHRPVVPRLLPEVGVHLACGVPGVQAVEYVPWLSPLFTAPPAVADGNLVAPTAPGLGLELNADVVARFRFG